MRPSTQKLISEYMMTAESMDLAESTREQKRRLFEEISMLFENVEDFDANQYRLYLLETGRKKVSVNSYVKMTRPVFKWAVRQGWIVDDPFDGLRNFRLPQERIHVFKPSQIEAMLAVSNYLWQARIMAAATAGMRRSEVLNLTLDDIDFERGEIVIQPKRDTSYTWSWMPKNKKCRVVPLSAMLHNLLISTIIPSLPVGQKYLMLSEQRHWYLQRKKPLPYRIRVCPDENFTKPFKRIKERAGISGTFHDLRRTCITNWTQNPNLSPQEVKELAGHAEIETTMRYYAAVRYTDICQRAKQTTIGATGLEPATS